MYLLVTNPKKCTKDPLEKSPDRKKEWNAMHRNNDKGDDAVGKVINKRNCLFALVFLFLTMAIFIGVQPYDPMDDDIADATTNAIWTEQYSKGVYEIPYENWTYGGTQSVVVWHDGHYVVVNEKGPGLVIMLVPFHMLGIEFLFGPIIVGIAVFSTYMLGNRLVNWRVGFIAGSTVLLNLSVIIMWFRYYWTDAATMHMLILSVWLLVEANYWFNGRSLVKKTAEDISAKHMCVGAGFALLSGLAFGASVSTRYPVGIIMIAIFLYMLVFYLLRAWPSLRKGAFLKALNDGRGLALLLVFIIGLAFILIPLTQYNSEYFGGPFKSGYDATSLKSFEMSNTSAPRDQSTSWLDSLGDGVGNAWDNIFSLGPTLLFRMPALIMAPLGIWLLRKNKPALVLLITWILIGLFTYMSLSWVDMYTGWKFMLEHAWEPRYFMPVVPASAILGAIGINYLAFERKWPKIGSDDVAGGSDDNDIDGNSNHKNGADNEDERASYHHRIRQRRLSGTLIVGAALIMIAIPGIYPAMIHFSDPDLVFPPNMNRDDQGKNPPDGKPDDQKPPPDLQLPVITTDQLLSEPQKYEDTQVQLEDALVTEITTDGYSIRNANATATESVPVRLVEWPDAEKPTFDVGDTIGLSGRFHKAQGVNSYEITVKWGTKDYLKERV